MLTTTAWFFAQLGYRTAWLLGVQQYTIKRYINASFIHSLIQESSRVELQ